MPANYVLLEKITVGAVLPASITFSNIPQTGYTDLVMRGSGRTTADTLIGGFSFNGVTTNLSARQIYGTGSAAGSTSSATNTNSYGVVDAVSYTANTFGNFEAYFPNYTSSAYKSFSVDGVVENNATEAYSCLVAGLWSSTAAITSITFKPDAGNLTQYSTFYLYGVAKLGTTPAIVPYATGGDTIMTDGTYWYHTFISSGTFTPAKAISCDYLVVAGGGGGGRVTTDAAPGGGGGGGGLRSTVTATGGGGSLESALSLTAGTGYTVTIGGGGAGTARTNGSNSVFSTITSTGGGYGGGYDGSYYSPATGGSGGGGNGATGSGNTGAAGTANQGYAGGNGINDTGAGGGGGAGSVGSNAVATRVAGAGGSATATSISGSSVSYAGGGGGGGDRAIGAAGGTGGGQGGGTNGNAISGTANTGGGGGGAGNNNGTGTINGGNGGSGIVIVRYLV